MKRSEVNMMGASEVGFRGAHSYCILSSWLESSPYFECHGWPYGKVIFRIDSI
ncbi:MAG TPA: hypothetical protein VHP63_04330 [candidate division Zixibacteria bacterium]|nr:hypothetical protein [candidate division Zixibacteria bacterium]